MDVSTGYGIQISGIWHLTWTTLSDLISVIATWRDWRRRRRQQCQVSNQKAVDSIFSSSINCQYKLGHISGNVSHVSRLRHRHHIDSASAVISRRLTRLTCQQAETSSSHWLSLGSCQSETHSSHMSAGWDSVISLTQPRQLSVGDWLVSHVSRLRHRHHIDSASAVISRRLTRLTCQQAETSSSHWLSLSSYLSETHSSHMSAGWDIVITLTQPQQLSVGDSLVSHVSRLRHRHLIDSASAVISRRLNRLMWDSLLIMKAKTK